MLKNAKACNHLFRAMQLRVREQLRESQTKTTTAGAHYKGVKRFQEKKTPVPSIICPSMK